MYLPSKFDLDLYNFRYCIKYAEDMEEEEKLKIPIKPNYFADMT